MRVYRNQNLVYIPLAKIASSSYSQHFQDLGWAQSSACHIDWTKDHVFAHIINPVSRHVKGIAECLVQRRLDKICENDQLFPLICTHTGLDVHTYTLHQMLGSRINDIDWLALDHPKSVEINQWFFQQHNIPLNQHFLHQADDERIHLQDKIRKTIATHDLLPNLHNGLHLDIMIYDLIHIFFDFDNVGLRPWTEISWLNRRSSWWFDT